MSTLTVNRWLVGAVPALLALGFAGTAHASEVVYEAEDQTWSQAVVESEHTGYTGTGYVNTDNVGGSWVEFVVVVPDAGVYDLAMRFANGSSATRPVDTAINGEFKLPVLDFAPTGAWTNWQQLDFTMTLEAGANIIRFIGAGSAGAPNFDSLTLSLPEAENQAPVVVNPLMDMTLTQGGEEFVIDLHDVFGDPDGDELSFDHDGSNNDSPNLVFTQGSNAQSITIRPIELGTERYDLIATDGQLDTTLTFYITVVEGNLPPVVVAPIVDMVLEFGGPSFEIDLNAVFSDPDGDVLSFQREPSDDDNTVVQFSSPSTFIVDPHQVGSVTNLVIAHDGNGGSASVEFETTVLPPASLSFELQAEDHDFTLAAIETEHEGYTGTGYVNTDNYVGAWLRVHQAIPEAADYLVTVRYANGSSNRAARVLLNSSEVLPVNFTSTGAWTNWQEVGFVLTLPIDDVSIELEALGSGGLPNIDKLTIERL